MQDERPVIISCDGHATGRPEDYIPYIEPAYRAQYDEFVQALLAARAAREKATQENRSLFSKEGTDAFKAATGNARDGQWNSSLRTEVLAPHVWLHFIASFTLSGLIALAYSLLGSQFVIQRALYPRMWDDVRQFTAVARHELAPMAKRLAWIQLLAGSALMAAILVLTFNDITPFFKGVVAGLIVLGWAGYQLATQVTQSLTQIVLALTGAKK